MAWSFLSQTGIHAATSIVLAPKALPVAGKIFSFGLLGFVSGVPKHWPALGTRLGTILPTRYIVGVSLSGLWALASRVLCLIVLLVVVRVF